MLPGEKHLPKVLLGLGNPGRSYNSHRHNVGARCVEAFARYHNISLRRRRLVTLGEGTISGHPVVVARSRTFVNLSGQAAEYLRARFRPPLDDLLVVYDDLDLPVGRIRLRPQGGSGGHNGVQDAINHLHGQDFPRLRIGIGRPPESESLSGAALEEAVVRHVLSGFTRRERPVVTKAIDLAIEALTCVVTEGLEAAMNRYN